MTYSLVTTKGAQKGDTDAIGSVTGKQVLEVPTATFQTDGAIRGDIVTVTSGPNAGDYVLMLVLEEDVIVLEEEMPSASSSGSVEIYTGTHDLTILDEATTDWDTINTKVPSVVEKISIGTLGNVFLSLLNSITINSVPDITTNWTSENEKVINLLSTDCKIIGAGGLSRVIITIGEKGSDFDSPDKSSVWIGFKFADASTINTTINMHGSFLEARTTIDFGFAGSADRSLLQLPGIINNSAFHAVRNCIIISTSINSQGAFALGTWIGNHWCQRERGVWVSGGTQFLTGESYGADADPVNIPLVTAVEALNFVDDISHSDLFTSDGTKRYLFNPRFVKIDATVIFGAPIPMAGLTITMLAFDTVGVDFIAIPGSPFTTDANGQINGGTGVLIPRSNSNTSLFALALTISGSGIQRTDIIELTSVFEGDYIVTTKQANTVIETVFDKKTIDIQKFKAVEIADIKP